MRFHRCNSHYSFQDYKRSDIKYHVALQMVWDQSDLIKVHPFMAAYGRTIISLLMLFFLLSVVSMCGVGGTIKAIFNFIYFSYKPMRI